MNPVADRCIVFIANELALPGLRAAVISCVEQLAVDALDIPIFIFHYQISERSLLDLSERVRTKYPGQRLEMRGADVSEYRGLLPLHGDLMTYFKLSRPEMLPEYRYILYLDADMLILGSLKEPCMVDLGDAPLAASGVGGIMHSLESRFLKSLGYGELEFGFNAGVLLLNAELWRKAGLKEKCKEFGLRHRSECQSGDQTILVGMYARQFVKLRPELNSYWEPWEKRKQDCTIVHFVGSPKPWDFAGRWLHTGYALWNRYARLGGHNGVVFWWKHGSAMLVRAWHIRRSLFRALVRRISIA